MEAMRTYENRTIPHCLKFSGFLFARPANGYSIAPSYYHSPPSLRVLCQTVCSRSVERRFVKSRRIES